MNEYHDKVSEGSFTSGKKWTKYESVTIPDGTINIGDMILWEDPDAGMHAGDCELVHLSEFFGYVEEIWDIEGSDVFHLSVTGPVGRISLKYTVAIEGEEIQYGDTSRLDPFRDHPEYDVWMWTRFHAGEDGVPEDLWESYKNNRSGNSGPHCEVCRSEDGYEVQGK